MRKIDHAGGGRKSPPAQGHRWVQAPMALIWADDVPDELVRLYLKLLAFDRGNGCTASAATLGGGGTQERQTRTNLQRLAALGWISIESRPGSTSVYRCLGAPVQPRTSAPGAEEPRQSTAGHPGNPLPDTPAIHCRTPRQSTAGELEQEDLRRNKYNNNADHERDRPPVPPAGVVVGGGNIPADLERAAAVARVPLARVQEALAAHPPERVAAALQVVAQAGARSPSALFRKALAQGWSPATAPRRRREGTRNRPNWVGDAGDTAAIVADIESRSH